METKAKAKAKTEGDGATVLPERQVVLQLLHPDIFFLCIT
jgi:hypothetical protein